MNDNNNNHFNIIGPTSSPQFEIHLERLDATEFATACEQLLKEVRAFVYTPENFRLELRVEKSKPKLLLLIDPCFWYRYVLNKDTRTEIARTWVSSIREEKIQHVMKSNITDPEQKPITPVRKYCDFGPNCMYYQQGPNRCHRGHARIQCKEPIEKRDQSKEHCGFFAFDELVIEQLGNEEFIVMSKLKADRELLVLPRPPLHLTNGKLIVIPSFWEFCFQLHERIVEESQDPSAISYLACNFGEWEKKLSQDNLAKECHACVHIGLSPLAQKNLAKRYSQLNQRTLDPPDYSADNIDYLEQHYLLPEEVSQMKKMLGNAPKLTFQVQVGLQ